MAKDGKDTRQRILRAAAALVAEGGPGALTFDAVAARLGLTKQAVIYWFPTKAELMAGVALPHFEAEAETAVAAMRGAGSPAEAARQVVAALAGFYLADLDRFRLMYVAAQTGRRAAPRLAKAVTHRIHPVTARMYAAIEVALGGGPEARETAVALHMAALGAGLLTSTNEAMGDPLAHDPARLAARLAEVAERGALPGNPPRAGRPEGL
jgi:AcrR family transcriptional regulator